jgi:hypothetical protein
MLEKGRKVHGEIDIRHVILLHSFPKVELNIREQVIYVSRGTCRRLVFKLARSVQGLA